MAYKPQVLTVSNGGTSLATLTAHAVYVGNGTSAPTALAVGSTGQVLTGNTGADPSWASPATSGTVTSVSVVSANGFAGTVANASSTPAITLTTTQTGLLSGNGTAITGTAITQYNVITGGASNAPNSVAPSATSGVPLISQGSSAQPIFGTAVVAGGGTGAVTLTGVLTGNGTSAITASAVTQYALLVGGASNAVGSVADVATGQVLVSGGVSANPAFTAYPQVSGLGIGASPGSTAGLTFDGSNFLSSYSTGTFSPTITGATTAGTTTYSTQLGTYVKIGALVYVSIQVVWTAATGTGIIIVGGLPFTVLNNSNFNPLGIDTNVAIATSTQYSLITVGNTTTARLFGNISATGAGINSSLAANTNNTIYASGCYQTAS